MSYQKSGLLMLSVLPFLHATAKWALPTKSKMFKWTMSVTDPQAALNFMQSNFPVMSCDDPDNTQTGVVCNGTFTGGPVGRSELVPSPDHVQGPLGQPFSIHMVNSSTRPIGGLSTSDVESQFNQKLSKGQYDQFMDFSLVVLSSDLNSWIQRWQTNGVSFFPLTWRDDAGVQYWSAIVQVPNTSYIFEVVSLEDPGIQTVQWHIDDLQRLPSAVMKGKATKPGVWLPLAVSKMTSSLATMTSFYIDVFGATSDEVDTSNVAGSVKMGIFSWPQIDAVVRVIERGGRNTSGELTVHELEVGKFEAHNMTMGRSFEESALCGMNKWYDNHLGFGLILGGQTYNMAQKALRARHWPYLQIFHPSDKGGWPHAIIDPTGDAVEFLHLPEYSIFDRQQEWTKSARGDALCGPGGSTNCADGGLIVQGNCQSKFSPGTSASCTAALKKACPDLLYQLERCSECVYKHDTFLTLKSEGCYIADTYLYCTPSKYLQTDPNSTSAIMV